MKHRENLALHQKSLKALLRAPLQLKIQEGTSNGATFPFIGLLCVNFCNIGNFIT